MPPPCPPKLQKSLPWIGLRPAGGEPGPDHLQKYFLTVCVSLSGLGPSETHEKLSMRKMCDSSNEKQGEKLNLL